MKISFLVALLCLTSTTASAAETKAVSHLGEPLQVGGGVSRPEKLAGDPPAYTAEARKAHLSGTVVLKAVISESGDVADVEVLKGLPMGLSEAAVKAVESWKFQPAVLAGRAVPVYYTLTVNFQVGAGDDPQALLKSLDEVRERFPEPVAADAPLVFSTQGDVTAGRSTLGFAIRWAHDYEGPSRSELLIWLGAEAMRRAYQRPAGGADSERAAYLEIGLGAEDAALATEGPNAQTWRVVEAKVWKHYLLVLQADGAVDSAAKELATKEAWQVLGQAQRTFNAVSSAASRIASRPPAVQQ